MAPPCASARSVVKLRSESAPRARSVPVASPRSRAPGAKRLTTARSSGCARSARSMRVGCSATVPWPVRWERSEPFRCTRSASAARRVLVEPVSVAVPVSVPPSGSPGHATRARSTCSGSSRTRSARASTPPPKPTVPFAATWLRPERAPSKTMSPFTASARGVPARRTSPASAPRRGKSSAGTSRSSRAVPTWPKLRCVSWKRSVSPKTTPRSPSTRASPMRTRESRATTSIRRWPRRKVPRKTAVPLSGSAG